MVRNSRTDGQWDEVAENMMIYFAESGHTLFRPSSAVERGDMKSKEKGMNSIQFNGSDETIELILRTVISVNQFSVYGAVADLCGELARDSKGTERSGAVEDLESMFSGQNFRQLFEFLRLQKFEDLPEQEKLTKLCSNAGFLEEH